MAIYEIIGVCFLLTIVMWVVWLKKVKKYKRERAQQHTEIRDLIAKMGKIPKEGQTLEQPVAERVRAKLAYINQRLRTKSN